MEVIAQDHWRRVDFISDLHLHPGEPDTHTAWARYMQKTNADALFILGDLFEVWVGDDLLDNPLGFESECVRIIRETARRLPVYYMVGNRDFLMGMRFADESHSIPIADPATLDFFGKRLVLSHGDAWCTDDVAYQSFRTTVRSSEWQSTFLAKPLPERLDIARHIRSQSEAKKPLGSYADVDTASAEAALSAAKARTLIHGHTHQPATHGLPSGAERWVLSDWHIKPPHTPRLEVLRLQTQPAMGEFSLSRLHPELCEIGLN